MNPPAYLTWLAVVLGPLLRIDDETPVSLGATIGLLAQLAFLGLFMARAVLEKRAAPGARMRAIVAAQVCAALVAIWGLHDHMSAILLVLVAAQLPALMSTRAAIAL